MEKPEGLTQKHLEYLDNLRESGQTNMFGVAPFLARKFKLALPTAREYLTFWTETFGERHAEEEG